MKNKIKQLEKQKKSLQMKATKVKTSKEFNDICFKIKEINSEIDYQKFWGNQ